MRFHPHPPSPIFLLALLLCLLPGCMKMIGASVTDAPNRLNPLIVDYDMSPLLLSAFGIDHQFTVDIANPKATLGVWVIDPRKSHRHAPPLATVLVLHGIETNRVSMLGDALYLADHGYRAVLIDLRGHGRSTGRHITFGVQESKDLAAITDNLQRRKMLSGPLGVYGISYGAAVAIQYAAYDPRVKAVVSVAAFSSLREEVPAYAHLFFPFFTWIYTPADIQKALTLGAAHAGFDADAASPLRAIAQTRARVLLLHGHDDWIIPLTQAHKLAVAGHGHAQMMEVPGVGHIGIWFDLSGQVKHASLNWFNTYLQ